MKLAIMQPYFFPYLGYYQGIAAVDKYMLYDNLAYIKEGWMNKNRLLTIPGKPAYIIVHVKDKSSHKRINEIELADSKPWPRKMLNTILLNYKKAPFFDEVYPVVERVITSKVKLLTELNARSIIDVSRYLNITTEITTDTSKYSHLEETLVNSALAISQRFPSIKLCNPEKKVIRVIEICRAEGAEVFVNAIGGQALYDKEEFTRHGIELLFLQTQDHFYPQSTDAFHPNLSIIDVLMNCGRDGTRELLQKYTLV